MTLPVVLFISILCHLIGDYLLQNDWMALNKTKSSMAALIHVMCYSLPFLFFMQLQFWLIIMVTHFFIDRFRLAEYWIRLVNWDWQSTNFGYAEDKPKWMSVWLLIIIDNTFHVLINTSCILFQYKYL